MMMVMFLMMDGPTTTASVLVFGISWSGQADATVAAILLYASFVQNNQRDKERDGVEKDDTNKGHSVQTEPVNGKDGTHTAQTKGNG
jgi:hypothetical protein